MMTEYNSNQDPNHLRNQIIIAISTIAIINIFALIYILLKSSWQINSLIKISPVMSILVTFISLLPATVSAQPGADEIGANASRVVNSGWNRNFEIDQVRNNLKEYGGGLGSFGMIPFFAFGYFVFTLLIGKLFF